MFVSSRSVLLSDLVFKANAIWCDLSVQITFGPLIAVIFSVADPDMLHAVAYPLSVDVVAT